MWIIGDDFMSKSFAQYFQNAFGDSGKMGYIRAHYDAIGYCQGQREEAINTTTYLAESGML